MRRSPVPAAATWSQVGDDGPLGFAARRVLCLLGAMQGLLVIVFPFVLMAFALAMEKVQTRLDRLSVGGEQVDEFLEAADDTDVSNLAKSGLPAALDELRSRRSEKYDDEQADRAS